MDANMQAMRDSYLERITKAVLADEITTIRAHFPEPIKATVTPKIGAVLASVLSTVPATRDDVPPPVHEVTPDRLGEILLR